MSWLLSRLLAGLSAGVAGGFLGHLLGRLFGDAQQASVSVALVGAVAGAALAMAALAVIDTLRGVRLIDWLRGDQGLDAPRDAGFWGEIAYRVERSLRLRERSTVQEKARLGQFLEAMDASPNGILMLDAAGCIDWCNSVAASHYGLHPQRDRLQPVTNLVRAPAFVAHLQERRFAEVAVFPAPSGLGTLSILVRPYGEGALLVLSQDITERERADAMRRDFVANVSHEIRTPLTVLAGFIETMNDLPLTEAERRRVLMLMGQQTARMQLLVTDLLTLAHLEGSPRPAADRWVPVARLLAQVDSEARSLSGGRHQITLTQDGSPHLAGAEAELLSALTNITNNAVRYTPAGGRIDIGWRELTDGSGEFTVKDTGAGIEREHLPRLTERFYRVDGSRSRDTGGTGLGLSIVKHVAQRHGGELDIQSEPGKGSTFRLVFPGARLREFGILGATSAAAAATAAAASAAPLRERANEAADFDAAADRGPSGR